MEVFEISKSLRNRSGEVVGVEKEDGEFGKVAKRRRNLAGELFEGAEVKDTEGSKAAESRGDGAGHGGVNDRIRAGGEARAREVDDPAGCEMAGDSIPIRAAVGSGVPSREKAGRIIGNAGLECQECSLVAGMAGGCCGGECGGVVEDNEG